MRVTADSSSLVRALERFVPLPQEVEGVEVAAEERDLTPRSPTRRAYAIGPPAHLERFLNRSWVSSAQPRLLYAREVGGMEIVLERDRERALEQDARLVGSTGRCADHAFAVERMREDLRQVEQLGE